MRRVKQAHAQSLRFMATDKTAAEAYVAAGRAALGRVHARFSAAQHSGLQERLVGLSQALRDMTEAGAFLNTFEAVWSELETHAPTSLYDEDTLRRALAAAQRE